METLQTADEERESEQVAPDLEDRPGLHAELTGPSASSATFPEGMDWSAVALLLAERAELPIILLSEAGQVVHVAPAAQGALGCHADLIGKNWSELYGSGDEAFQVRATFSKALSGATHRFDVKVPAASGSSLATFESYPIGHGRGRGVLLFLQKVMPSPRDSLSRDFDYEVEGVSARELKLRSLQRGGHLPIAAQHVCFEVLHGRTTPCERCPIPSLGAVGQVQAAVRRLEGGELEVTTAKLVDKDRAWISVRRLSQAIFGAMLHARIDQLAERGRLSKRERGVLELLVDGQSFDEIGRTLGITPRTVKYHQGKLLSKLGADSRSDLIRLLF